MTEICEEPLGNCDEMAHPSRHCNTKPWQISLKCCAAGYIWPGLHSDHRLAFKKGTTKVIPMAAAFNWTSAGVQKQFQDEESLRAAEPLIICQPH